MKTKVISIAVMLISLSISAFSQPGQDKMKPPCIEDRIKMINNKICQPLQLTRDQTKKVDEAFREFFSQIDKLMETVNPPDMPDKSKVIPLENARNDKVKAAIPDSLYAKYLDLEKFTRPRMPRGPENQPR